mmetsp:Transcript_10421/g.15852  ORF Transcript_10421/g.15852 Transcript_10421/m.15852 type:complete len:774 (-) Transcript_10421:41-2362(-)
MFGRYIPDTEVEWIHSDQATIVASVFASVSILISIAHIMQHLTHYTMPGIQIYVIRILFICPVYAICSALALGLGGAGAYSEIGRDVYEAFVIYSFLNLILEYCGGETDCIYQIENEPQLRMPCPLCFMKPMPRDARLMRLCHRGVLQFIIVKPLVAIMDVIMIATGNYYKLPYQIFEFIVYNISYAWALYCMFVFYLATKQLIRKFRPVMKFATVKAIVFATYYQSLAVKASSMSPEDSYMWNDLILCVEMVLFSLLLMCAFPTSEFQGGIPDSKFIDNVKSVLSVRDVMQDVYHNFMPVYQDYALQRSEKEMPEVVRVKTYLAGNLDSVAIEMSHRYRGRNKRFAFNSLLRGDNPIQARPRSSSAHYRQASVASDCSDGSDLGSSEHSDTSLNSAPVELESRLDVESGEWNNGGLCFGKSDELLNTQTHRFMVPPLSPPQKDEMTMSRVQRDVLHRKRATMATQGVVVSAPGVKSRQSYFHSSDEYIQNRVDQGSEADVVNPLVSLAINPSAANLPRLPRRMLKDDSMIATVENMSQSADCCIVRPSRLAKVEASVPRPVRAIPPPRRSSPLETTTPCNSPDIAVNGEEYPGFVFDDNAVHPSIFMNDQEDNWDDEEELWGEFVGRMSYCESETRSRGSSAGQTLDINERVEHDRYLLEEKKRLTTCDIDASEVNNGTGCDLSTVGSTEGVCVNMSDDMCRGSQRSSCATFSDRPVNSEIVRGEERERETLENSASHVNFEESQQFPSEDNGCSDCSHHREGLYINHVLEI